MRYRPTIRPVVHLSMWDRKNCQNTALAGDKQYVPGLMIFFLAVETGIWCWINLITT